jgi:ribosomal protein S12 methylthiotransferase accessory factor
LPLELHDVEQTPLADSLLRMKGLVSEHTGVIGRTHLLLASPDDIPLVSVFCETGDGRDVIGWPGTHPGNGSGRSADEAFTAAVGEAAERYSACYVGHAGAFVATAREIGAAAVEPERFSLYSDRQYAMPGFPYARFTSDTRVAWVTGAELPSGATVYLPAQLVYLAWPPMHGESRIGRSTSNGLAAHATTEEAILRGLLELVERDVFMITWRARLSLPQLSWDGNLRLQEFEQRYLSPTGIRVAAVDLSRFWNLPCVLGVARSDARHEAPIEKALDEAVRVRSWARELRRRDPNARSLPPPAQIRNFDEHVAFYAYDENAARASFLDAGRERRHVSDVARLEGPRVRARIDAICGRLEAGGATAYMADVTAPDVRGAGLRVIKVVAPELCPLDVEHAAPCLGGRRLYDVPWRLGLRESALSADDLNPDPHPFP